ncbi:MAG: GNAT family N-acetyltransferase, partial [Minisyncoccia bacterium]
MFVERGSDRYILLNGICSPEKYKDLGVGQELINTLIRIGKSSDVKYINLDCKGQRLMNYYRRFGFIVTKSYTADDSDDSDDEGDMYYKMTLDLSRIRGGKKKNIRTL